jgi:ribosomal-protein-alanine N-acetyltransferase
MFPEHIDTERLRLDYLSPETADPLDLYPYLKRSPEMDEVTAYVSWKPHATPKDTLGFIEHAGEQFENAEGVHYALYPTEGEGAGEFAGTAGFTVEWDRRTARFGMWLRKPFWGRGYAGERAAAFFAVAFDRLDLELAAVEHIDGNEKSRRAIEKYVERAGGQHDGLLRNWLTGSDGEPHDAHHYTVSKEQWREATGGEYDAVFHG